MTLVELLERCADAGITLTADRDQVKIAFTSGPADPALVGLLQAHKPALLARLAKPRPDGASPIPRLANRARARVSFAQRRLWFVDRLDGGGARQYNIPGAFRLSGALDAQAFERALRTIVSRHEVLRATFIEEDGDIYQHVREQVDLPLERQDLSALDAPDQHRALDRVMRQEASRRVDLATDLPVRVVLVRLSETEHVILLNIHHIAADGWSMGVLTREFEALYGAFSQGREHPLPPLPVQYAEYAEWERTRFETQAPARELATWTRALAGCPAVHGLPLDRARPARQAYNGAVVHHVLDAASVASVRTLCQRHAVTPFILLQTLFALLVARCGHGSDVVIGAPVAGRRHPELESLIGLFVNHLVLRVVIDGNPTFAELLRANTRHILDAYACQSVPFDRLVEALNVARGGAHHPVFQIVFGYNDVRGDAMRLPDVELSDAALARDTAKVDLEISVADDGDTIVMGWIYDVDLFLARTISALAASYESLLTAVAADDDVRVFDCPILDVKTQAALLARGAGETVDHAGAGSVCARVVHHASRSPEAIAVSDGDVSLTYRELDEKTRRLAQYLRERDLPRDARIGVHAGPSVAALIAVLGILRSGRVYVPLDPGAPKARNRFIIDDAGVPLVVTSRGDLSGRPFDNTDVMFLDGCERDAAWLAGYDDGAHAAPDDIAAEPDGERLAYILYTSGTTGQPKGVAVRHAGLANYLACAARDYLTAEMRGGVVSTRLGFDATLTTFLAPLCAGLTVSCPPDRDATLTALSARLFSDSACWLFKVTPAHLESLLPGRADAPPCLSRHVIVIGGDQLTVSLVDAWRRLLPNARFVNEYGPTETVVGCSTYAIDARTVLEGAVVPIGRAIPNASLYVLGPGRQVQPDGSVGELYIGGAGVAAAYVGRPDLTAERFVPDPFASAASARMYRTGDLVRWQADGNLLFIGRADRQVKIRGYRVEPGEIEAQLIALQGVRRAAVSWRADASGENALVAYLVVEPDTRTADGAALVSTVKASLEAHLPEYMVPSRFVILDELPLTANGKIDDRALQAMEDEGIVQERYVPPRDVLEEALCRIWQELLGVERVGIRDNFFALGGHSILAIRLVSTIRQRLGLEVPLRALFEHPTVAALVPVLQGQAGARVVPPIALLASGASAPLSYAQQRLWFLDRLEGGSSQYNLPAAFEVTGPFDLVACRRAMTRVVERHAVLRTRFVDVDGDVHQEARRVEGVPVTIVDLRDEPAARQAAEVTRRAATAASAGFDLRRDLLVRVEILQLAVDRHVVLVTMHHIASDGWSMGLLIREFSALYAAYRAGREDPLPPLTVQYADYAVWQRQWLQGPVLDEQIAYWRARLAGAPLVHDLPLDRPRPVQQRFEGRVVERTWPADLSRALQAYCRTQGVTLFMLLQTAFAVLLARQSDEADIVMATTAAGRRHSDVEGLIGCFINTLVLRTEMADNPRFSELLARSKERILEAYTHQDVPFEMVVEMAQPERSLSHNPVAQILFSLNNTAQAPLRLPDVTLAPLPATAVVSQYDLELNVRETGDGIAIGWPHNVDLFEAATIERWADAYRTLVESVLASPDARIADLAIMSADERAWLLAQRGVAVEVAAPGLHAAFEAQAARTPDAHAVVSEDETLSYRDLNARANRLAHYLRRHGVGPDVVVGLCAELSVAQMVGVLGILKAGGAYVPLDPSLPESRLADVAADAGVELVVCQSDVLEAVTLGACAMVPLDGPMSDRLYGREPSSDVDPLAVGLRPDHLAYVLYTSGSTGRPKGVEVSHRAVQEYCAGIAAIYYGSRLAGTYVMTSLSFDLTVPSLYLPWMLGGYVRLAAPQASVEAKWRELQRSEAPYLVRPTPSHVRALAGLLVHATMAAHVVTIGGEALSGADVALVREHFPRARVFNDYGPTEAIVSCTAYEATDARSAGPVPIGRALGNARPYVRDRFDGLAARGAPGELCVGRPALARGYRGRAALTAERFVADPFGPTGGRLYRTGDRVRWRADGELEFLGRVDQQVKVRGYRIELGEIEACLAAQPDVHDCAAAVRDDRGVGMELVAYVVPRPLTEAEDGRDAQAERHQLVQRWREALKQQLPGYMTPAVYVVLEALPLTPNGKIDRRALPRPAESDLPRAPYVAPRTAEETALCAMCAEVLGLERVGIHDNFFELGGHSLLAMRLVSLVRERLGRELPLRLLFEQSTVASLADSLGAIEDIVLPSIPRTARHVLALEHALEEGEL